MDGADIFPLHAPADPVPGHLPGAVEPAAGDAAANVEGLLRLVASVIALGRAMERSRTEFFRTITDASILLNRAQEFRRVGSKAAERQIIAQVRSTLNAVSTLSVPPPADWPDVEQLRREL